MNPPTTPKQVRAFLGLVGYYRKFIRGFAKIAKPLTLTRQQVKFDWTPEHTGSFHTFEGSHSSGTHPTLSEPNQDIHSDRCFRCLYSSLKKELSSHSIFVPNFYGNAMQMEHHRTGGLWSILCHHQNGIITYKEPK